MTGPMVKSLAHRIVDLAEAHGGQAFRPLNKGHGVLTTVLVIKEGLKVRVAVPTRFATKALIQETCTTLNIPVLEWPPEAFWWSTNNV